MNNPINNGSSKLVISEQWPPFIERQVCCNYQGQSFIGIGNYRKKKLSAFEIQWQVALFVNTDQILRHKCLICPVQSSVVLCSFKIHYKGSQRKKLDLVISITCINTKSYCCTSYPGTTASIKNNRVFLSDEVQGKHFHLL